MSDAAAIGRQYLEAWNRRDWATFGGVLHRDYTYIGGDGQVQKGPEAGLAIGQMFATAFPDGRLDIRAIHSAGPNVAIVEFTGRGTQTGELMGIPPTGRTMTLPVCSVIEVRDGQIIAEREYMDMLTMMQQLGVAPEVAATA